MSLRTSLKKVLPPISVTEQEALDAGDVWLESSIYQGKPDFKALRDIPNAQLTADEQAFMDGPVKELLAMIDDYELQNDIHIPQPILDFIAKERFYSLIIPKKFGGREFSPYANSTIVATIAAKSCAVAVTVMVPNSLGPGELLMHYGTEQQQQDWLPRLADGREIPCFALTSPEAGSDAGAIPDVGVICKGEWNGEEVLGLKVSWDKRYITLAPIATVLGLAFKVFDPDGLLGDKEDLGITCALIPKSHPGVQLGNRHNPMGMRFYNGTTRGHEVFIPMDFVIGGQKNIGRGWQMLVSCLGAGRGISLPALGVSTAQNSFKSTAEYSVVREQFGMPIGRFEGIQEKLADISGKTFVLEAMRQLTTEGLGLGLKPSVVTAIAKYHMTELGRDVLNSAMDIQAGKAIQLGPQNTLSYGYTAQPIAITVEGANILTRSLMIFGQGSIRCHPYIQDIIEQIHSDEKGADSKFSSLMAKTVGFSIKNAFRSLKNAYLPFIQSADSKYAEVKAYEKRMKNISSKLATVADFSLLVLGGDLKRAEMLSARLGDIISYMYAGMACIRFYENKVADADKAEAKLFFDYAMQWSLMKAEGALAEFLNNFPVAPVRWLMRGLTGTYAKATSSFISDELSRKLSEQSLKDTNIKRQLTNLVVPVEGDGNDINEKAFTAKWACMDELKQVQRALKKGKLGRCFTFEEAVNKAVEAGVVDNTAREKLMDYEEKRLVAIRVDEFDFDLNLLPVDEHEEFSDVNSAA